jgi:hypothetical protein
LERERIACKTMAIPLKAQQLDSMFGKKGKGLSGLWQYNVVPSHEGDQMYVPPAPQLKNYQIVGSLAFKEVDLWHPKPSAALPWSPRIRAAAAGVQDVLEGDHGYQEQTQPNGSQVLITCLKTQLNGISTIPWFRIIQKPWGYVVQLL